MKPLHLLFLLLIDMIWGFNAVAVKIAVTDVEPITATFLRFAIVLAVCVPFLRLVPGRMPLILATGFISGALMFALTNLSFALTDNVPALAVVGQLGVPFSLLFAILFLGERIRWIRTVGIAMAFAGVVFILFDPALLDERLALAIGVASALVYGIGTVLIRQLGGVHPLTLQAWLALVSVPVLLVMALLLEPQQVGNLGDVRLETFGWLLFSAVGSSVIGHSGMSWLLQRYPVSTITPLTLPSPLVAILASMYWFDDPLTWRMIIGGLIALGGVAVILIRTAEKVENHESDRGPAIPQSRSASITDLDAGPPLYRNGKR